VITVFDLAAERSRVVFGGIVTSLRRMSVQLAIADATAEYAVTVHEAPVLVL
jgi:hypothetical protein